MKTRQLYFWTLLFLPGLHMVNATENLTPLSQLNKNWIGQKIGLGFFGSSVSLNIDAGNHHFFVMSQPQQYAFCRGDQLRDLDSQNPLTLSVSWQVVDVGADYLLLNNEVIQGNLRRFILVELPKSEVMGFYVNEINVGDPEYLSYYQVLALTGP